MDANSDDAADARGSAIAFPALYADELKSMIKKQLLFNFKGTFSIKDHCTNYCPVIHLFNTCIYFKFNVCCIKLYFLTEILFLCWNCVTVKITLPDRKLTQYNEIL